MEDYFIVGVNFLFDMECVCYIYGGYDVLLFIQRDVQIDVC